jgi:hypothetical protein
MLYELQYGKMYGTPYGWVWNAIVKLEMNVFKHLILNQAKRQISSVIDVFY